MVSASARIMHGSGLVLYMSLSDIHDDGRADGLHGFTSVANMGQDRQGLQVTVVDGVESGWSIYKRNGAGREAANLHLVLVIVVYARFYV